MIAPVFVEPDWPVSPRIKARVTTRAGGFGRGPFAGLNLAYHVGDEAGAVEANRALMQREMALPAAPNWLSQVHGNQCLAVDRSSPVPMEGDAAWSESDDIVLAVMVADCLPVFLASRAGDAYAVVHAGWQGLASGVIGAAIERFRRDDLIAWMGPAIGPCHYEVDRMVREAFGNDTGFRPGRDEGHWMLDLYAVAREQLKDAGVSRIFGGGFCTWCESDRFFSYRRDGETGRMAALIWKSHG